MEDWDAVSEDEENFEVERRNRELSALKRRFETLGFEAGLNSEQDLESIMQKSFDTAFADAMAKGFVVGKRVGLLSCIKWYQEQAPNKTIEDNFESTKTVGQIAFDPERTMGLLKQCMKADPSVKKLVVNSKSICDSIDAEFSKQFP